MRTTKRWIRRESDPLGIGPQLGFAAATFSVFAAWSGLVVTVRPELVMPIVTTLLLVFAVVFGLIAWRRGAEDPTRVTYADVAGALTLIGLFAASTLDPDQVVRMVVGERTES
jgi:hypothetical protein